MFIVFQLDSPSRFKPSVEAFSLSIPLPPPFLKHKYGNLHSMPKPTL